jgi:hypothetical protein
VNTAFTPRPNKVPPEKEKKLKWTAFPPHTSYDIFFDFAMSLHTPPAPGSAGGFNSINR